MAKSKKKIQEKFAKVSVQKCMTPEERKKRRELIDHCKMKREETGFDLVIFANHIVPRADITDLKSQFTKPDFISTFDPDYVDPYELTTPEKIPSTTNSSPHPLERILQVFGQSTN